MSKNERIKSYEKLEALVSARDDLTIYKLASFLNMSRSMFSDWKIGRSMPKTEKLIKIAEYFDVPISYFIVVEN